MVWAQSSENVVCAAVHPCNPDGTVQVGFDKGPCAERYRIECARDLMQSVSLDVQICETERVGLEDEVKVLKRKLRASKRELRRHE